jgi:cellulose synthase/poly-beta-1,6-N-acetylglucosamine synthase-like glycosyltransferase
MYTTSYSLNISTNNPPVLVIVPIAYVPGYIFSEMIDAMRNIQYDNFQIFVTAKIADHDLPIYTSLRDRYNFTLFIEDDEDPGYKARALNRVLVDTQMEGHQYAIIVDGYHIVNPSIIRDFVSKFNTQAQNVVYIQAGVDYTANNLIGQFGRTLRAHLYYYYIQARSQFGNAQFNGSTCCFKLDILRGLGGFPEYSYTENSALSVKLQLEGYQGKFLAKSLSTCPSRSTLSTTTSQLYRWGHGLGSVIRKELKPILKSPNISRLQKLDILWYQVASSPASSLTLLIPLILSARLLLMWIDPSFAVFLPLESIMIVYLIATFLSFFFVGTFVIFAEDSQYGVLTRYYQLIIFTLLSFSFPVFILDSFSKGYNDKDGVFSEKTTWAKGIHIGYRKMILTFLAVLELGAIISAYLFGLPVYVGILAPFLLSKLLILPLR